MSLAKHAQCSQIARNIEKGKYVKQFKFANYGSVVEDSIQAQQAQADARLLEIQAQRKVRTA
jgi:hypothetical protein